MLGRDAGVDGVAVDDAKPVAGQRLGHRGGSGVGEDHLGRGVAQDLRQPRAGPMH